ncbi:MAG: hypothetical protein JWM45_3455 [Pseudonocardiales bacterium]|nr:hypothetical protein [Pseudonocardiales bacterium]
MCSELILWEVVGQLMGRRSPVDGCHVCVEIPSGRDYRVKSLDLLGCQLYGAGADVLLEPGYVLGAGMGTMSSPWASSQARATCAAQVSGRAVALCKVGAGKIGNLGWLDRHDQLVEGSQDP